MSLKKDIENDYSEVKRWYRRFTHGFFGFCIFWAFVLNMFMETLARKGVSIVGGIHFMVDKPLVFLFNMLIIFATLTVGVLFRRRFFAVTIVSALWLAIGIANGVILMQRMTPFTVKDLSAITEGATLITNYLSNFQIILIAVLLIALVVGIVVLFIKGPKVRELNFRKNVAGFFLVCLITGITSAGAINGGVVSTFFGNLAYAYRDYGIPYCFISTWVNTGIKKPSGYSKAQIDGLLKDSDLESARIKPYKEGNPADSLNHPNIIYLQLESFVDPRLFKNIQCDIDPIPNYRQLMKEFSSGIITVPACGAGTANTEFETLTGVSARFFGPGEYPYKSALSDKTMESTAYDLKTLGYATHAIHNHRAVFYNRNIVFKNLGFDTFTSLEYMSDVDKTPKNWAKDYVLTDAILDALKSTKNQRDYVHTISVQGHGKYPPEQVIKNPAVKVTAAPNEEMKWKYEYYVNQIYEMDKFVKKLTEELERFDEPTVLVMFGDHIPALDITEESYALPDLYATEYVIWSNFNFKKEDKPIKAYELSADLFKRLGIKTGTILQYGNDMDHDDPKYLEGLKALSYDMLYGKRYTYGGKEPFKPSKMKMGVKPIKISRIVEAGGKYYIKGENFTEYSKVTLNGKLLKTFYLGSSLLGLQDEVDPKNASKMKVSQIDRNSKEIISTTE